jgi:hypothetical protein
MVSIFHMIMGQTLRVMMVKSGSNMRRAKTTVMITAMIINTTNKATILMSPIMKEVTPPRAA